MENDFRSKYLKSDFAIQFLIKNFFKTIKKTLEGLEFKSVLEVGAGAGFSTKYLRDILRNKDFEASELEEDLVREAQRRNHGLKIEQESIYKLKRKDNSFDLIIALEVLEHLKDPEEALKELHRVSSKYCVISVPNEPLWRILNICRLKYLKNLGNTPGHIHHWSNKSLRKMTARHFKTAQIKNPIPWIILLGEKKYNENF